MTTWMWQVPVYLWLAGMAGGAYFAAFLAESFRIGKEEGLLKAATWLGVPAVILGSLLLTSELGQPLRFMHLFGTFFPLSPMSVGSWLLLTWGLVGAAMLVLWYLKRAERLLKVLSWINFVLSVLLIAYTGVLLSTTNQPLWSKTLLLPALFVVTSISRGIAFLTVVVLVRKRTSAHTLAFLGRSDVTLYILDFVALVAFLIALGSARKVITTGILGFFLWVGVVLMGILIPLGVGVRAMVRGKDGGLLSLLAALWAIAGGLVLRDVIVLGGQLFG
jgi:formate-dependent nitrite reductase membrane component NrfD